jgi:hypothetical protein
MTGVFYGVVAAFLILFFKFNLTKWLGVLLMIAITLVCWYSTLISAIVMGQDLANQWAVQYILSFGID